MKLIDQVKANYEKDPLDTIISGFFFIIGGALAVTIVALCIVALIYGFGFIV